MRRRARDRAWLRRLTGRAVPGLATLSVIALGAASTALADFPYTGPSGNPHDPTTWKLPPGVAPSNFADNWKLAATPEQSPQSDASVNSRSDELCGVRGMSVVDQNATFPGGWYGGALPERGYWGRVGPQPEAITYLLGRLEG